MVSKKNAVFMIYQDCCKCCFFYSKYRSLIAIGWFKTWKKPATNRNQLVDNTSNSKLNKPIDIITCSRRLLDSSTVDLYSNIVIDINKTAQYLKITTDSRLTSLQNSMKNIATPESEFIKSIDRFQLLSLATKEGIWEYDFTSNESFYNDGITALFGHGYPELEDNNTWWRNNIHPQDKNRIINALDELLRGDQNVWWGKYQFRCKNGSYKLILDRLFVVRDAQNKPIRLIGTMQDLTELNSLEQEFENIRKEHQQTMQKAIFEAEENERKKISEELYENINQVLSAINLHIAQAKNHVTNEGLAWLEEAQILLLESISGICVLSKRLSPVSLQLLGLQLALDESLTNVNETNQIDCTLQVEEVDLTKITIGLQTVFYRIAQLQLSNIIKHSSANCINIKFSSHSGKTKMSIFDNGKGIDLKKVNFGKGFSTVQQKSAAFGGTFNLESIEGKAGFTMEVII